MDTLLPFNAALRLLLVYGHLLLCAFALVEVLSADWRLLHMQISARLLRRTHRHIVWLLAGLWVSGAAIVAVDGLPVLANGKLVAKLTCVSLLTVNGVFLRCWCLPRLVNDRPLRRAESWVLMSCGATSTTCWLMAGFYGVARPLASFSPAFNLLLLGAALAVAWAVALMLSTRLRQGRQPLPGSARPQRMHAPRPSGSEASTAASQLPAA